MQLEYVTGVQDAKYYLIDTNEKFDIFYEELKKQSILAIDTESSGLNWVTSNVCGISIGWGLDNNYYLTIDHKNHDLENPKHIQQLDVSYIVPKLRDYFSNKKLNVILWNSKFDLHGLRKLGIEVLGTVHDCVPLYFLLDENDSHALKDCAVKYLDKEADKWEKLIDSWRGSESKRRRKRFSQLLKQREAEYKKDPLVLASDISPKDLAKADLTSHPYHINNLDSISYDLIPLELMLPYAASDVHYTFLLFKKFYSTIQKDEFLKELYKNELLLSKVLFETESSGVLIDREYLLKCGPELEVNIDKLTKNIYNKVGYEFNIGSTPQLVEALLKMNVKLTKLSKKSQEDLKNGNVDNLTYSVDADVLEKLAKKYPFAKDILDLRAQQKLKQTYVEGILARLDPNDYLHVNFNANVTSGRMSSNSVNLQNIPAEDKTIRRAFTRPSKDYLLIYADYSQVELRLLAHLSQDPYLLTCYPKKGEGVDLHTLTCAEVVLKKSYDELKRMENDTTGHTNVTGTLCKCPSCQFSFYRKIAKTVSFSIAYGTSGKGLAPQISSDSRQFSVEECDLIIRQWFDTYKNVKKLFKNTIEFMKKYGYVVNQYGRKRRFPEYWSSPRWMQGGMERTANNYKIQSFAADIFKISVVRMYNELFKNSKSRLTNFVHDEVQFYIHKDELHLIPKAKQIMEDFDLLVPLVSEWSYSLTSWADKVKIKDVNDLGFLLQE